MNYTKQDNILVESEFAPLKKVVLAQSEFMFAESDNFMDSDFLTEESLDLYKDVYGKSFEEAFPKEQIEWEQERENLKNVLEKYNVEVVKPRLLTDYEKQIEKEAGCCNFFIRDPFFTIGNLVIEGSLRFTHRRNEILPARDILIKESNKNNCLYLSIPKPDISNGKESEEGPFLEGGDILVLDKTVFVGTSGLASNKNGISWLRNLLFNFGYEVVEVPLHPKILHLDCAISFVRRGLMIVCEEALLNGIPKELSDWEKINVTLEDSSNLAVNGLPINENVYITDSKFKFIGDQLEEKGIRVEYIDFKVSRSFGGSFRCSTQPLLRKNNL